MTSLKKNNIELYHGPSAKVLKEEFASQSVHSIITSPPYYNQRDYHNDDQIGNEDSIESYLDNLCEIFDECHRVLRDDGTLWVNLGDKGEKGNELNVPFLFAEEMKKRGWYQRRWFPWLKRNGIPRGGNSRPHDNLEVIFMFTKRPRNYYYDQLSAKEAAGLTTRNFRNGDAVLLDPDPDFWVFDVLTRKNASEHFACVDEETECLTKQGWKKVDDISIGDEAAQFDMNSEKLSWSKIQDIAIYDVQNQSMIESSSTRIPMLLTPNHRCIIYSKNSSGYSSPKIVRADELRKNHYIPVAASWEDSGTEFLGSDFCELLGWYISEGHECKDSSSIEIYQSLSVNESKCSRIEYLLQSLGAEWKKASYKREYKKRETISSVYRVSGYIAYKLREIAPQKLIPLQSFDWSNSEIGALLSGLILGDGHSRDNDKRHCFVQKSKYQCDIVQILAIRIGWSASVSVHNQANEIYVVNMVPERRMNSLLGTAGKGDVIQEQKYSGRVWCPKLEKGTWVARKNGRVFITGNTFPPLLAEIMLRASTSDFGVTKTGEPIGRLIEKKRYATRPGTNAKKDESGMAFRDSGRHITEVKHLGWDTIEGEEIEKPIVLDPFSGMATVGVACINHGRAYRGIEVNADYLEESRQRLEKELENAAKHEPDLFAS